MRAWALAVALASCEVLSSSARADVLIDALPRHLSCGDDIVFGVWYQSYSGGPRWARLSVRDGMGRIVARRKVRATTTWRYYRFSPDCEHTYYARYVVPGGSRTYRVRVGL